MFTRLLNKPLKNDKSFFLFGPRGVGKTVWVKTVVKDGLYLDLLESKLYLELLANPQRLENHIPKNFTKWIIIDEVQRVPQLLNEVHRLIEEKHYKFILTGSSARSLRRKGINLLAGRALTYWMHPLTAIELGINFNLEQSLNFGQLPSIPFENDPKKYLESYVKTYLREEVLQEGLTRNITAFSRFLEAASFSQGSVINYTEIARETSINRKVIENYFQILEDLLLAKRLPVFTKRAKRKLVAHPKFYFFDTGVYRTLRPKGPLDSPEEIDGAALETLIYQDLLAKNDYFSWGYQFYYWRTHSGDEVDFILYGEKGITAIEIKRSQKISLKDLKGLKTFAKDYPEAKLLLLYGGERRYREGEIEIIPITEFLNDKNGIANFFFT